MASDAVEMDGSVPGGSVPGGSVSSDGERLPTADAVEAVAAAGAVADEPGRAIQRRRGLRGGSAMVGDAMSAGIALPRVRLYRQLRRLRRDPLGVLREIGEQHGDALVQLDLGLLRPYLVTHPEQVAQVWARSDTYQRSGMMWDAMHRIQGRDSIGGEGPGWARSRRVIQPLFTAKAVAALTGGMVDAINDAVDDLTRRVGQRATVDVGAEMMRITHRVLGRVFLGDRIPAQEADTVGRAISTAFASMQSRLLLPFVPHWIPLPGDRRFHRAVRTVDGILLPHIARARAQPGGDVVSIMAQATDNDGVPLDTRLVRDDVVGLFTGGTETTAVALTWLIVLLDAHPDVTARMRAEADDVVGAGPVTAEHTARLDYTRMVLRETLRIRPPAWMIPRTLVAADVLAGVPLTPGDTVILSPFLTHHLPGWWPEPDRFDPERFAAGTQRGRHPYAFHPFGGGVHRCLGSHFFEIESALAAAALFSRFHIQLATPQPIPPRVAVSLQPQTRVRMTLTPIRG